MNHPAGHLPSHPPQQKAGGNPAAGTAVPPAVDSTLRSGLDDGERLRAVASLGEPVRKDLFDLVRGSGRPLSRDDCAAELGLPRSTVRAHLDRLVEEQLLVVEFRKVGEKTGPGSGRPTKLYTAAHSEVSASVPPRHYDLAAGLLAAAVQRSIDTGADIRQCLADVARQEGRRLGSQAGTIHELLVNAGYSPESDGEGGTVMANCPFHRLSQDHAGVMCALNGSLLGGALEGCDDASHTLAPDEKVSHCCARLVPKQ